MYLKGITYRGLIRIAQVITDEWRALDEAIEHIKDDPDTTYTVRETGTDPANMTYDVVKWGLDEEPESIYEVTFEESPGVRLPWRCSCPAFKSGRRDEETDKHIQIVKAWIDSGKPSLFDPKAIERVARR